MDTITITLQSSTALLLAIPGFWAALTTVCATFAVYLPPPTNGHPWYALLHRVVNYLGQNRGHAENKQ